ncbi:MAG: hypothetical protein N2444_05870, partial [Methylocystis sp.]|nr:hypothetical protein [Methylocystis sp.]
MSARFVFRFGAARPPRLTHCVNTAAALLWLAAGVTDALAQAPIFMTAPPPLSGVASEGAGSAAPFDPAPDLGAQPVPPQTAATTLAPGPAAAP